MKTLHMSGHFEHAPCDLLRVVTYFLLNSSFDAELRCFNVEMMFHFMNPELKA
jgi:hypothetical protein